MRRIRINTFLKKKNNFSFCTFNNFFDGNIANNLLIKKKEGKTSDNYGKSTHNLTENAINIDMKNSREDGMGIDFHQPNEYISKNFYQIKLDASTKSELSKSSKKELSEKL